MSTTSSAPAIILTVQEMTEGEGTALGTTATASNNNNNNNSIIMDGEGVLAKEGQDIHIASSTDDEELLPIMMNADDDDDHQLEKEMKSTGSKAEKSRSSNSSSRNNNKKKKKKIRFRRCNSSPDFDFSSDDYDLSFTVPLAQSAPAPAAVAAASMSMPPPPPMLRSCLSKNSLDEMVTDPDQNEGRWSASSSFSNHSNDVNEANNTNSSNSKTMMKRNVSFGHIEIREHPIVLGDHPAVSSGPALSLGWFEPANQNNSVDDTNKEEDGLSSELRMCLEEYEKERQQGGAAPRRTTGGGGRHQLVVPKHERQRILQNEAGVTMNEMRQVEVETNKIKKSRYKTKEKEQRKFYQEHYNNNNNNNDFVSKTLDGVWKKIKVMSASTTTGIGVVGRRRRGRGHHHKQQQQQRELDDLMHRAALAEQIRKEQQQRQKMKLRKQKQQRSKNRSSSAVGGCDQPPTVPKRGDDGDGSVGGTIDLDQPPTVPRRRTSGYDDHENTACTNVTEEEDTNEHIDDRDIHVGHDNTDGDDYDATIVKEVEVTARSDTQQHVPSSTKSSSTAVDIDFDKPVSPPPQSSPSTTQLLFSPKALSHSTSEPLLVWLSHNNHGDTASSSTSESDVDDDGDGDDRHHHHEGGVNDDDRVVVGMDVAVDDDEPFMF